LLKQWGHKFFFLEETIKKIEEVPFMVADDFERIYQAYKQQSEQQARMEATENQSGSSGKEEFVAVRKNDDGDIIAFKTNSGRELDYITALEEAKAGNVAHIDVFHKYGRDIIRSEPDGIKENNLDQLPEF
jgi:Protein of unknown function (DUF3892)